MDRGILLRDILESGVCWKEKGYALLSTTGGTTVGGTVTGHQRNGAAEPVAIKPLTEKEMDYMVRETKDGGTILISIISTTQRRKKVPA